MLREVVRSSARAAGFAAWTAGVVYGWRALKLVKPGLEHWDARVPFIERWSEGTFSLMGVALHLIDGAPPTEPGPFLVVSNHRSPLDILIAVHLVGGVVLSHEGVARIPVVGAAARATDTVFVNRSSSSSGARAIREMRSRLRSGRNLIVFPEGTTFEGDEVRPFKRGAFSAAKGMKNVQVLPIGLAYEPGAEFVRESFGQHLLRMSRRKETPVWATIGRPVSVPKNPEEIESLRQDVQKLVDRAVAAREAQGER